MIPTTLPPLADERRPPSSSQGAAPVVPFYLMSTEEGQSVLSVRQLADFAQQSVGGGAAPQWLRDFPADLPGEVVGVKFAVLPVGWVGEWHESPQPQWVVPLSGRWFLETMDGRRAEMGPGDLHFGQDQGTAGERGHRSGQLGDAPCVQLLVQFSAETRMGAGE